MAKRAQLLDVDDTPISPVTSADTVYIDEDTTVGEKIDAINENLSKLVAYSSEEIDTGKVWVDGKKIYRKCYSASGSITSNVIIDSTLTMSYVDNVIMETSLVSDGDYWIQDLDNSTARGRVNFTNSGLLLIASNFTIRKYNVILEYTKA